MQGYTLADQRVKRLEECRGFHGTPWEASKWKNRSWLSKCEMHRRGEATKPVACYAVLVNTEDLLAAIDQEIARLQSARNLLDGSRETRRRGRPPATGKRQAKKRTLSPAARQKIAEAQRKRWAAQKKRTKKV